MYIREVREWYCRKPACRDTSEGESMLGRKAGVQMWAGLIQTGTDFKDENRKML